MVLLCDVSFQVIANLSQVLDKQKEKIEKMRTFTHWRIKHTEAKEEVNWFFFLYTSLCDRNSVK